jgi:hypothetical protein
MLEEAAAQCDRCGGEHPSEGCRRSLIFQGYVFSPPYLCMCCGGHVTPRRWLKTHACERCEWGACGANHDLPLWCETDDGTEAFELYVEYVEAIPRLRG